MTSIRSLPLRAGRALALLGLLMVGIAPPATASAATTPASASASASAHAAPKPVPTPPAGVPTGPVIVPKPHRTGAGAVSPRGLPTGISSVTLSSSCPSPLWATQYCTLTATADGDVGPTPYSILIFTYDTGTFLKSCGYGTTCSVAVTSKVAASHDYIAYIGVCCGAPAPGSSLQSGLVFVNWASVNWVTLAVSAPTRPLGGTAILTATTDKNVGPTPFYIQLWDLTTGTQLASCGNGSSCPATVSQSAATTHAYVATVASWGTSYPPPYLQVVSQTVYVTWSSTAGTLAGWNVSISVPTDTYMSSETVTAMANADVGPTPYDILIYVETGPGTGTLLAACGTGASCSVTSNLTYGANYFVAFIAPYSTALPPANAQAASFVAESVYHPF